MIRKIQNDISPDPTHTSLNTEPEQEKDVCPICGGAGYYVLDVPVGHPLFGKAIPCECKKEEYQRLKLRRLLHISQLPYLADKTFESFSLREDELPPAQVENLRRALLVAKAFAEEPHGWVLFSGGLGTGKTHLAAAIANERLRKGESVLFVVVPDLLDHLRATFHPGSDVRYDERFEEIRNAPVLILDDLGAESSTPWAQEKLYQLINSRYTMRLPTVFTTNVKLERLEPRIRSRLLDQELTTYCHLDVPDYRLRDQTRLRDLEPELNMLPYLSDMTFDTWDTRVGEVSPEVADNLARALDLAKAYAEQPHNWLVLTGPYGSGKTHLAAAIANERARRGDEVLFVVVPDFLDYLRAAFNPESHIPYDRRFEEVKRAPLLVLDDLGTESATPWAREKLYQLLNFRYNAKLPTVITTATPIDQLDARIRTRLLDPRRSLLFALIAPPYLGDPDARQWRRG